MQLVTFHQMKCMENENFIENIGAGLGQNVSVNNIYGEPIQSGEKTIIPVARIAYGFGGGFGHDGKSKQNFESGDFFEEERPLAKEGGGAGGGIYAKPKGVYEVTPTGTRFIPASSYRQIFVGIAIGFLVKAVFFSRKRRK